MAGEVNSQGAGLEHLSEGQTSSAPAPTKPKAVENANGSGDGVTPIEKPVTPPVVEEQKPKVEPKVDDKGVPIEEDDENGDKVEIVEYENWEDPSAAAAVELLKEAGVSAAQARGIFEKAIESGDLRDINVKELEAKVGKAKALLIMNGVTDYHRRLTETNNQTIAEVKKVFGGDRGWDVVKEWAQARELVDPAFKKELDGIREDLNKGGRAAKAAAKDLLKAYNGAPNTKGLGNGNLIKGDGRVSATGEPLSRAAYVEELKKAHASGATQTTINQINARREAGRKAGI